MLTNAVRNRSEAELGEAKSRAAGEQWARSVGAISWWQRGSPRRGGSKEHGARGLEKAGERSEAVLRSRKSC